MSGPREEYRFRSLDGLRGVAALMVAFCHFITAFHWAMLSGDTAAAHFAGETALSHTPLVFFYNADLCITIFFIISGFVLAASVVGSGASLPALIARRWVRLALPVTGISLFAFAIPALGLSFAQPASILSKSGWLALQYCCVQLDPRNFAQLIFESLILLIYPHAGWGTLARYYNTNLWTMPIEFVGSIGLFVIYRLLLVRFPPRVLFRLAVILLLFAGLWQTPYAGFPAGAALFECFHATRTMRLPRFCMVIIGAPVFFAGLILGSTPFELNLQNGGIQAGIAIAVYRVTAPVSSITVMHGVGALCLVAGALLFAPVRMLLESRLCQFLGKISFMVYLVQIPILCFTAAGIVVALTPRIGYNEASVIAAIGYLACVLATATLFTRYIDAPAIRASRRASRLSIFRAKTSA